MQLSTGILNVARKRLEDENNRTEADLRRVTSDLYYALFHRVCEALVQPMGYGPVDQAFKETFQTLYRLPEHSYIEKRSREVSKHDFSSAVKSFANQLVLMKNKRRQADYDPLAKFPISVVRTEYTTVRSVIGSFDSVQKHEQTRFAYFISLKSNRKLGMD